MKGISHFTSAIAAATFIPGVVALASQDRSLILLLAGVLGLLPDWLDFKIARYFEPADEDIEPNALNFDAQDMAGKIAEAMRRAFDEDDPLTLQLYSAQLGPDRWRRYSLQFDPEQNEIILRPGPLINGGIRRGAFWPSETGNAPPAMAVAKSERLRMMLQVENRLVSGATAPGNARRVAARGGISCRSAAAPCQLRTQSLR